MIICGCEVCEFEGFLLVIVRVDRIRLVRVSLWGVVFLRFGFVFVMVLFDKKFMVFIVFCIVVFLIGGCFFDVVGVVKELVGVGCGEFILRIVGFIFDLVCWCLVGGDWDRLLCVDVVLFWRDVM